MNFRSFRAIAIWLSVAGLSVAGTMNAAASVSSCETKVLSLASSPDDKWLAVTGEHICSDGGFVTTLTAIVRLVRRDDLRVLNLSSHQENPDLSQAILSLDIVRPEDRPAVRWTSHRRVQINIPNKSLPGLHKAIYEGIDVIVKYEPDDPEERARFLRSLGRIAN